MLQSNGTYYDAFRVTTFKGVTKPRNLTEKYVQSTLVPYIRQRLESLMTEGTVTTRVSGEPRTFLTGVVEQDFVLTWSDNVDVWEMLDAEILAMLGWTEENKYYPNGNTDWRFNRTKGWVHFSFISWAFTTMERSLTNQVGFNAAVEEKYRGKAYPGIYLSKA